MLLLFIFPSLVFLWPLCAPLLSHPWSSHSFSPLALSFKNQVALGQQLLMGSCLSCGSLLLWFPPWQSINWLFRSSYSLMSPTKPSTSLCLLKRMVGTGLSCDRMIHDLKITWQWFSAHREGTFTQADQIITNSDGWQLTLGKCKQENHATF